SWSPSWCARCGSSRPVAAPTTGHGTCLASLGAASSWSSPRGDGRPMEERFQHLLAINRAIAGTLDYEELLRLVVDKTAQLTGARACALLLSDQAGVAHVVASRGIDAAKVRAFAAPLDERIDS